MNLHQFLESKPLYYDEIDYTRMPRIYAKIRERFLTPKIIHIIGTNGKGTTGRFLATALYNLGFSTGHYTSPHILFFNERIWLDGKDISEEKLEAAHKKLQHLLSKEDSEALSYFEYTTFLAMVVYEQCDYVVLEAGLGGEHDATAVFDKTLTILTPVGKDHESFLGETIEEIAATKLRAVQNNLIVAQQVDERVYDVVASLAKERGFHFKRAEELLSKDLAFLAHKISDGMHLAPYLSQNLSTAIATLSFLELSVDEQSFRGGRLFGRLSRLGENIVVDVGHNTLAATKIVESLSKDRYILVYNSYKDKDYKNILKILKPIVASVELIEIDDVRIEKKEKIEGVLQNLEIPYQTFTQIQEGKNYLVFGSFSVVEAFLKVHCG